MNPFITVHSFTYPHQLAVIRGKLEAEGIESGEQVISRLIAFLRETAQAYPGKTVLVVCHGGAVRTLLLHLGYADLPRGAFQNAGYVKLRTDGVDFFLDEVKGVKTSGLN